jgi:amidase
VLNAVVLRWFDDALDAANDPALPDGPFRGVPFLLKDLWAAMAGHPITNGNRALKDSGVRSDADTTLVSRHRAAGLVILGRTNSPEFGSVPTTEPLAYGPTHNPWALDRTPGGSSGGAAAAVAAGLVPIAHASDGGGSIRIPASACGLVGLKPSQGRITLGPARDESGLSVEHCVSRTVRDCAALLDATAGPGIGDTVIAPAPTRPYRDEVGADPGRLRIGLMATHPKGIPVSPECEKAARSAAHLLEGLGHHVEEAHPDVFGDEELGRRFGAIWSTNQAITIARIEAMIGREITADDVEPVNWAMAQFAKGISAVEYAQGLAAVSAFRRRMHAWWTAGHDLLLTPTLAHLPPVLGTIVNDPADPMRPMTLSGAFVPFTPAFNTSGQPAISLPLSWTDDGLPVGVQLVGAYGREDVLLRIAGQLEQASPWAHRHPAV